VELYFTSVGRNSKLLLNVPPTRDGVLHPTDTARLVEMRQRLDATFAPERRARPSAARPVTVAIADLREDITRGQSVARYAVEGFDGSQWHVLSRGTTIGHRKLDRFPPTVVTEARVRVEEGEGEVALAAWGTGNGERGTGSGEREWERGEGRGGEEWGKGGA
jgi:alpha-L-fucosidase